MRERWDGCLGDADVDGHGCDVGCMVRMLFGVAFM